MDAIPLRQLTDLHGAQFIERCYARLLHREADESGKATFLSQLQNGESKAVIIGRMLRSAEGRQVGEKVEGLWPRYFFHRLMAAPLIGQVVAILSGPFVTATLSRDVKTLQARNAELSERLASSFNDYLPGILDTMSSLHAQVCETQNRMDAFDQTLGSHERKLQMKELTDAATHRKFSADVGRLAANSATTQESMHSLKAMAESWKESQSSVTNFLQSYPAAARETTRQLVGVGVTVQSLTRRLDGMAEQVGRLQQLESGLQSQIWNSFEERIRPMAERLLQLNSELASMRAYGERLQDKIERVRQQVGDVESIGVPQNARSCNASARNLLKRMDEVEGRVADADGRAQKLESSLEQQSALFKTCESVFPTLDYLSHRVEFVRREVLFEAKYGRAPSFAEQADTVPRVLDQAAVDEARKEGLRLNIGCGHVPIEGYVNVDRRVLPNVQVKAEAYNLPFQAGEILEIYSAHLLEHFPQEQLRRQVLPHWRALLAPGIGKLIAIVPDAEVMLREYHGGTYPYESLREVVFGGQDCDGDFHFNMFIPEQLSMLLREAGFREISWPVRGRVNGRCIEMMLEAW